MPLYVMYANADVANWSVAGLCIAGTATAIGARFYFTYIVHRAAHKFDDCTRCTHGKKWCAFATPETIANLRHAPIEERVRLARLCERLCKHIPTEPCGEETDDSSVGDCHHKYDMCVMPKAHRKPQTWATIAAADTGKSFAQFVDVKTATEADREAHRAFIRKQRATASRRAAASSPTDDVDMDEMLEPA